MTLFVRSLAVITFLVLLLATTVAEEFFDFQHIDSDELDIYPGASEEDVELQIVDLTSIAFASEAPSEALSDPREDIVNEFEPDLEIDPMADGEPVTDEAASAVDNPHEVVPKEEKLQDLAEAFWEAEKREAEDMATHEHEESIIQAQMVAEQARYEQEMAAANAQEIASQESYEKAMRINEEADIVMKEAEQQQHDEEELFLTTR